MSAKSKTKRVSFCCPHHGMLSSPIEYFSMDMGSKRLVDVPLAYCKNCQKYYTPFANLLALVGPQHINHKGCQIAAGCGHVEKSFPKIEVRVPFFVNIQDEEQKKEQMYLEKVKERRKQEILRKEKTKQYIEGLRKLPHCAVILTNKACFIKEYMCPQCKQSTRKENVVIVQYRKSLLTYIRHCEHCGTDYITPEQFYAIEEKAFRKIYGNFSHPFVRPKNVDCEYEEGKYLFIPSGVIDFEKFSQHHLPPRNDMYYDMNEEEYQWVKMFYLPEEFLVRLREKSFLGEAGYSTNEPEIRRHIILEKCVNEYGKNRVINQLKTNMNLRIRQKDGDIRYARALNIWRRDICYVENEL